MTDSVSKNYEIGAGVAKVLQSSYIMYHLRKSHPVKASDCSNIHVLADTEKQLDFWSKSQTLNQVPLE